MGHTVSSIRSAVDFYHDLGGLINFYGHEPSNNGGMQQEYVTYSASKPNIWKTNAVGIYDWWLARSSASVTPTYREKGSTSIASAAITGATDPDTSVEIMIPNWNGGTCSSVEQVLVNGSPTSNYRTTSYGVKCRTGSGTSIEVHY